MGTSMHVFLLNLPRLEFAAFIPKGDYLTLCLLGEEIDKELVKAFLDAPEVRAALPPGVDMSLPDCKCSPRIAVRRAVRPYRDRAVLIGDCGVTRLFKDGIGAAYRTAKAAANTAVLQGISEQAFHDHYWKACMTIDRDNTVGRGIFMLTRVAQAWRVARRAMLRMITAEQKGGREPVMSTIVWDMFTGSAPYKEIFLRGLNPVFLARLAGNTVAGMFPMVIADQQQEAPMKTAALGRAYRDGELIVREGEVGDCMYVIQSGAVEVVQDVGPHEVRLAVLEEGDFFGEMAIFERQTRSATVRARGDANVLTVDKRTLLRRFQEDPSLAFRMVETLSHRVRKLDAEMTRLKSDRVTGSP
jgi:CRP-like cAMP-binding protein